jgi:cullin 3
MMEVIQKERDGEGIVDRSLVVGLTQMLIELDGAVEDKEKKAYTSIFEDEFLAQSRSYFRKEASSYFEIATATQYLERVRNRLREEEERTSASTGVGTPAKIQRVILEEFVERYKEALVKKNGSGVLVMLLNNNIEELKLVYEVLSLVDGALGPTIDMFKEQALKEGKAIVKDPENDKNPQTLVVQLKELFEFTLF